MTEKNMCMNTQGRLIRVGTRMDYAIMTEYIDILCERYPFLSVTSMGQTVLGRRIPLLSIGKGKKAVLYIGAQKGTESGCAAVLLRYVNELCEYIATNGRIYNRSAAYLSYTMTVNVVPMLDPDGIEYSIHGIGNNDTAKQVVKENQGDITNMSLWKGNARGISLRENFGNSFEEGNIIGLEPETGAIRNYLMFNRDIRLALSFSQGDRKVMCTYEGAAPPRLENIGRTLASMYCANFFRSHENGTLSVFCAEELAIPSFEITSEYKDRQDIFIDYYNQRKLLFFAPTLL